MGQICVLLRIDFGGVWIVAHVYLNPVHHRDKKPQRINAIGAKTVSSDSLYVFVYYIYNT